MKDGALGMTISAVNNTQHFAQAPILRGNRGNHASTHSPDAKRQTDVGTVAAETGSGATEAASGNEGPKGVLGLLQSGHFKGVAAARLSINFHEQLNDLNQATERTRVEDMAKDLDEQITVALEGYPEGTSEAQVQHVTEAQEKFTLGIRTAVEGIGEGETGRDDALSGMQAAFDELMQVLESTITATDPSADDSIAAGQVAEDDSGTVTGSSDEASAAVQSTQVNASEETDVVLNTASGSAAEYLETIAQVFNSLMEGLHSDIDEINAFPEFTAPNGNGVAFEKFVAMYREIVGVSTFDEPDALPASIIDQQV